MLTLACAFKMDSGPCLAYYPSWYFDTTSGVCMGFTYGGCGGNANRFDTKKMCADTCMGYMVEPGEGGYPKEDDEKNDEEEEEEDSQKVVMKN